MGRTLRERGFKAVATPGWLCYIAPDFDGLRPREGLASCPTVAIFPARNVRAQDCGRVDVSEPASISTGIAQRYATAVFDLAREGDDLAALTSDVEALRAALAESAEFRDLISSPVYSRDDQGRAISAIAGKMGLTQTMTNVLGLMASKRRLFALPQMLRALDEKLAEARGEVTADVTTAKPLSDKQKSALAAALKESAGREVKINQTVDESLIGGLVVKLGSKMIDTSIRSKLNSLQNAMKEVG